MCGAYPEIGKRISLAMHNEGIVCVTYGDAVILMTAQTYLTIMRWEAKLCVIIVVIQYNIL